MTKHYAPRDHMAQGDYYVRHVSAMTAEGLHNKSAIAAELAHRDMEIERLRAALAAPAAVPVGWRYDEAQYGENDVRGRCWRFNVFSQHKPTMEWMVQNVTPLYAAPAAPSVPTDTERRPYGDLRNAKWLDPECYEAGACQSLKFKAVAPSVPPADPKYTRAQLLAAIEAERHACSIVVWMTLQDALAEDADDKGLDGWMREAESRVKNRHSQYKEGAAAPTDGGQHG